MHAFVGVGELALQKLNGIIADLLVDFTNVGASSPGGGGAGDYRPFRAEDPYKRKNYPAEQRAALVPKQYLS